MSFARNYCDAAEIQDCVQFILDIGVVEADDCIGSSDILNSN